MVGVVGGDFGDEELAVFERHNVDTTDLERVPTGQTFFWRGRYDFDLNTAHTLDTQLNVFADFKPKLSPASKQTRLVFLGNIQPDLQREVREQVAGAELVALDTMNYWINTVPDAVWEAMRGVDVVIINDAEARQLAGEPNLHQSGAQDSRRRAARARHQARRVWRGAVHAPILTLLCPRTRSNPSSTRRARATPSRAASWATSPATNRLTKRPCGAR